MNAEGEKKCVTIQYVQLYEEGIDKGCLYDGYSRDVITVIFTAAAGNVDGTGVWVGWRSTIAKTVPL